MRFDVALARTIVRELFGPAELVRTPEEDLVMDDERAAAAYARGGRPDGALAGTYLYHLAQMCRMVRPGDAVLDVGCGPANLLAALAALTPDARYVGVDLSEQMLGHGRTALAAAGAGQVELRRDDMTTLATVADRSVDVVLSSMTLHHLPDADALERTFAAIARVLRPDGGVYLADFGRLRSPASVEYFVARAADGEEPELSRDYDRSLRAAFSRQELEDAARRHLGSRVRTYATVVSPLIVVMKTDDRRDITALRPRLLAMAEELPPARRDDLGQLSLFLRLDGLRSAI